VGLPIELSGWRATGEGHAPVVAVLLASAKKKKADESIAAPKGRADPEPHGLFSCKSAGFRDPPEGTMIAIVDPQASRRRMVGEGHAPVLAVLLAPANGREINLRRLALAHGRSSGPRIPS
jgi:hypothetical protein